MTRRHRNPDHDPGPATVPVPAITGPIIPGLGILTTPLPSTTARAAALHLTFFKDVGRCSGRPVDHHVITDLSGSLGGNGTPATILPDPPRRAPRRG
jgi:hypothetical protein